MVIRFWKSLLASSSQSIKDDPKQIREWCKQNTASKGYSQIPFDRQMTMLLINT